MDGRERRFCDYQHTGRTDLTYDNDNSLATIGGISVNNDSGGNIIEMTGSVPAVMQL